MAPSDVSKERVFSDCVLHTERVDLPRETMEWISEVDFHPEDRQRFDFLSFKAHEGTLTFDEAEELNDFDVVDGVLELFRDAASKTL